jgi:hypothetical protein
VAAQLAVEVSSDEVREADNEHGDDRYEEEDHRLSIAWACVPVPRL